MLWKPHSSPVGSEPAPLSDTLRLGAVASRGRTASARGPSRWTRNLRSPVILACCMPTQSTSRAGQGARGSPAEPNRMTADRSMGNRLTERRNSPGERLSGSIPRAAQTARYPGRSCVPAWHAARQGGTTSDLHPARNARGAALSVATGRCRLLALRVLSPRPKPACVLPDGATSGTDLEPGVRPWNK